MYRKEAALGFLGGFLPVVWLVFGRPIWIAATIHPGHGLRVVGRATPSEVLRRACGRRWGVGRYTGHPYPLRDRLRAARGRSMSSATLSAKRPSSCCSLPQISTARVVALLDQSRYSVSISSTA